MSIFARPFEGGLGFTIAIPKEVTQAVDTAQQAVDTGKEAVSTAKQYAETGQQAVQTAQQAVSTAQDVVQTVKPILTQPPVARPGSPPIDRTPPPVAPEPVSEKLKDYAIPIGAAVVLSAIGLYFAFAKR